MFKHGSAPTKLESDSLSPVWTEQTHIGGTRLKPSFLPPSGKFHGNIPPHAHPTSPYQEIDTTRNIKSKGTDRLISLPEGQTPESEGILDSTEALTPLHVGEGALL